MRYFIKIASAGLILFTTFMAFKHSWPILSNQTEGMPLFGNGQIAKGVVNAIAILTLLGGVMILFPYTFFWGNYINAANILFMMMQFLIARDFKYVLIEIPFLVIPFLLLYLKHPMASR